ncbi:MAG: histidinol dehydrogenase [Saprospiraceae bacterium]|nr:histidinol dehydrogenase [Saprospiraceae bacterium]
MKIYKNPDRNLWADILKRPAIDTTTLFGTVGQILKNVKDNGDNAVREYALKFDKSDTKKLLVSKKEFQIAEKELDADLKTAILTAKSNIERFHKAQKSSIKVVKTMTGIDCWRKSVGIERVGLYIPGGTAPLFSTVLMLGVPAKIAGCKEVVLCTPSQHNEPIHPAILFAAKAVGIKKVYKIGGVQAIAAMAYGTETVPQVWKIFGPGNQYVTAAKQLINTEGCAIDMPAGPSEVMVIADKTARPKFVAADLLSQAEHGVDSQVVLVAFDEIFVQNVLQEIENQLLNLSRADLAKAALDNSVAVIVNNDAEALAVANYYAAEHLIISTENADDLAQQVVNAGSVFIGHFSPESVGDYASGTNHVLPTNGFAHAYSGVSLDSFVKKITFQRLNTEGVKNIGATVIAMAEAEQLTAHANAVRVRLEEIEGM